MWLLEFGCWKRGFDSGVMVDGICVPWFEPPVVALNPTGSQRVSVCVRIKVPILFLLALLSIRHAAILFLLILKVYTVTLGHTS